MDPDADEDVVVGEAPQDELRNEVVTAGIALGKGVRMASAISCASPCTSGGGTSLSQERSMSSNSSSPLTSWPHVAKTLDPREVGNEIREGALDLSTRSVYRLPGAAELVAMAVFANDVIGVASREG